MAMLKNKKKLRRLARMTSGGFAGRALLTLAVAGMLVVPSMAGAADVADLSAAATGSDTWKGQATSQAQTLTGNTTAAVIVTTGAITPPTNGFTTLTITGLANPSTNGAVTLNIGHALDFSGLVTVTGGAGGANAGAAATLKIAAGATDLTFKSSGLAIAGGAGGTAAGGAVTHGVGETAATKATTYNANNGPVSISGGNAAATAGGNATLSILGGQVEAATAEFMGGTGSLTIAAGTPDATIVGGDAILNITGGTAATAGTGGAASYTTTGAVAITADAASTGNAELNVAGGNGGAATLNGGAAVFNSGDVTITATDATGPAIFSIKGGNTASATGGAAIATIGALTVNGGSVVVTDGTGASGGAATLTAASVLLKGDGAITVGGANAKSTDVADSTLFVDGAAKVEAGTLKLQHAGIVVLTGTNALQVSHATDETKAVLSASGAGNTIFGDISLDMASLTLASDGDLTVYAVDSTDVNQKLGTVSITENTILNGGRSANGLTTGTFAVTGAGDEIKTTSGALNITANQLALTNATTLGATNLVAATTVTLKGGVLTGTPADFLGNDLTITGANGQAATLNLTADVPTEGGISAYSITVDGDAVANTVMNVTAGDWTVGGLEVGKGALSVSGAGTKLTVTDQAGFTVTDATGVITLTGGAALDVSAAGAMTAGTAAGDTMQGIITVTNGTLTTGDLTIANADLVATGATAGQIAVTTGGGKLDVQGNLKLTNNGDITTTVTGDIVTNTLTAFNTAAGNAPIALNWSTGTLTLNGTDKAETAFLTADSLTMTGTKLTLALDENSTTGGGTYTGQITMSGAGSTLTVEDGTWNLGKLKTVGGSADIDGNVVITSTAIDALQSDAVGKADHTTGINLGSTGVLTANKATLVTETAGSITGIAAGLNQLYLDSGSVLNVKGYADGIKLSEAKLFADKVLVSGGGGMVKYDGKAIVAPSDLNSTVTGLEKTVKSSSAEGTYTLLEGYSVGYDQSAGGATPTVTTGGFGADSLVVKTAATASKVDVTLNASLTLLGDAKGDLVGIVGGDASKVITDINANGNALTFGSADAAATAKGKLNGNVALGAGSLTVVNGQYEVKNITGTTNNELAIAGTGILTAGSVGAVATEVNLIMFGEKSMLNATSANLGAVDMNGGSIIVADAKDATKGTLTVVGAMDITGGTLQSSGTMNIVDATLTDLNGATLIAGGDLNATGKTLTAGENGLNIVTNKSLLVAGLDSNGNKLTAKADILTATDNVELANGSSLTVTGKGSTIAAGMVLGTAGAAGTAGSATFTQDLTVTGDIGLLNGSALNVGEFKSDSTARSIIIGNATDTKGSALTIGSLTSSATASTFIIDPAGDKGILQVKAINSAAGSNNMNDIMIADANSILSFGAHDKAWTEAQMKMAGSTASSVLVIGMPVKMGIMGQIIVDSKYDSALVPAIDYAALDVRGDRLIIADLAGMRNADGTFSGIQLNAGDGTVNIDTTAGLRLTGDDMRAGQSYTLVSGISDAVDSVTQSDATTPGIADKGALTLNGGKSSNYLLVNVGDIIYNHGATANNGTLTVNTSLVHASTVLPRLSGSTAGFLDNMAVNTGFNSHSSNAGVRFVSRALDRDFIGINDVDLAAATIEGATQTAAVAGVQGSTFSIANASSGVAATRTSFAQPLMDTSRAVAVLQDSDNNLSLDGLSAGNGMNNGFGLWVMPMYQADRVSGMKAGSFKSGYNSDFGGVVLGADYTFDNAWRIGAAFNVGAGHASSKGDFNKTKNNFEFWGISMYGGWTMNNFGISADLGYTSTSNDVKQALPFAMGMDSLKSKADSSAWTVGAKAEYKLETSVMEIVPYIGVRYMGLNTSSYDAKSAGQTVFNVGSHDQSVFTFPIGVNLSKTIETGSGWKVRPQAQLGVIPAVGDLKTRSTSTIPGIAGSMTNTMNVVDSFTFDGGVGLDVIKDNLSFGVKYNIQASQHRTGHGVFGTLRYEY